MEPFGGLLAGERPNKRLQQRAIQAEIDLRHAPHGREPALVLGVGLDDGPDVIQGALLEADDPVAADEFRMDRVRGLAGHHRLVQTGRQHVDQIDVGSELIVLLAGHAAGDEDAEMADALVDGIDDGLTLGEDILVLLIQVADPTEGLLRRGNVVPLGAKADDGRADVPQVDPRPVAGDDFGGGQPVADEQLIDDPLHFLGIEVDVAAPPFLEFQEARPLGIDLGPHVVVLGPEGVGGIEILEVGDDIRAVELAGAEVAGQRGQPASADDPAGVSHRVLALDSGPVG